MSDQTWQEAAGLALNEVCNNPLIRDTPLDEVEYWLAVAKQINDTEVNGDLAEKFRWIADAALQGFTANDNDVPTDAYGYAKDVVLSTIISKQHDYGHENITWAGLGGIIIRMHDKVARIKNLVTLGGDAAHEALSDSWLDLVGYSVIALMVLNGSFELELADRIIPPTAMPSYGPQTVEAVPFDGLQPVEADLTEPEPDPQLLADCDSIDRYADLMDQFQRLIKVGQYKFGWSAACTVDIKPNGPESDVGQEAPNE